MTPKKSYYCDFVSDAYTALFTNSIGGADIMWSVHSQRQMVKLDAPPVSIEQMPTHRQNSNIGGVLIVRVKIKKARINWKFCGFLITREIGADPYLMTFGLQT